LIGTAIILSSLLSLSLGCLTYMRNFDYRDGEIIWNDVIAKRPHNAAAYLCLATIYHRNRNFPKAIEYLNIATKKTDTSVIHYNLGVIYDELRNNGEAIKHYKEAIAMNPNDSNSMNNMALSLVNLGKVRDAVPLYQKAVALSPKNPNFYANLATAMALIGNMRDSLAFFAKSLEFNEANSGVHEKMAVIYAITGDRDEAIAHLKRAVTLDPNNLKAQEKLAFLTGQGFRGCVPPAGSLRRH
jgi:Flp pilus assembly protein TadD